MDLPTSATPGAEMHRWDGVAVPQPQIDRVGAVGAVQMERPAAGAALRQG